MMSLFGKKLKNMAFYLYFQDEQAAKDAVARLTSEGCACEVRPSADGSGLWLLLASRSVDSKDMVSWDERMEQFATSLGAEYDGNEIEV